MSVKRRANAMYLYILRTRFLSRTTKERTPCFRLITRCPRQLRDVAIVLCVLSVCFLKRTAVISHDQDTHTYNTEIRKCLPTAFTCPYRTLRYRKRSGNKFSQRRSKKLPILPHNIPFLDVLAYFLRFRRT